MTARWAAPAISKKELLPKWTQLSTDRISRKLTDWRLLQFATKSDHAVILVDPKLHRSELKKFQSTKSYILSKAQWEELTEEVSKKLDMESSPDVNQAVEHFTETITSAMNSTVPETRKRAPGQPKWWNENLQKIRCEVQKLRRRTWKAKADHSYARWRNTYKTASRKYASAVDIRDNTFVYNIHPSKRKLVEEYNFL